MKKTITIWTLARDTREGTNCKVFATEEALGNHFEQIIRADISSTTGREVNSVLSLLEAGKVWEAWEIWCDKVKDTLDSYHWDSQPLQIEI